LYQSPLLGFSPTQALFATLVYRYESTYQGEVRPPGSFNSGYIDLVESCGQGLFSDVVYDLCITGMDSPNRHANGNPLPVIPARTYSLSDAIIPAPSDRYGNFYQTIEWDATHIGGPWQISFLNRGDTSIYEYAGPGILSSMRISSANIDNFWPLEYNFNESSMNTFWVFTGTRNVPESGGTVLILILSGISLGVCRLATRATKPACKTG
jgi:hypothetical protein